MKKVLIASPYGGISGGISRWTSHILEYHKKYCSQNWELSLIPMDRTKFINNNTPIWKRLWFGLIDYHKILDTFNQRIKSGYDIIHITSSASLSLYKDIYMLRRAKKMGVKCVIHFHFGRIPELARQNNWEWKLIKKVINLADKAVVIDKSSYDTLAAHGFSNIEMLPNPVAPIVEKIVAENKNIQRVKRQILFTGHVVKTKGVFELLKACSSLDDIHLKIAGHVTPEMQQDVERLYGKPKWLSVCGEMPYEDVIKEMMSCDIFVLPTYTEGFPNVILEAMATGCAIISTPVGAIPQMLEEDEKGKYGLLVAPKDIMALISAIKSLLDDEIHKDEMRRNVSHRVAERYNIESVWQKLVSIWESC